MNTTLALMAGGQAVHDLGEVGAAVARHGPALCCS